MQEVALSHDTFGITDESLLLSAQRNRFAGLKFARSRRPFVHKVLLREPRRTGNKFTGQTISARHSVLPNGYLAGNAEIRAAEYLVRRFTDYHDALQQHLFRPLAGERRRCFLEVMTPSCGDLTATVTPRARSTHRARLVVPFRERVATSAPRLEGQPPRLSVTAYAMPATAAAHDDRAER